MSLIRPFAWLAVVLAVLGMASPAMAQRYQPFIDPGYFNPDFQFFAPAEVGDYSGGEEPNEGVYFDYDKMYLNVNRPDGEASLFSEHEGDFVYGNRYELGYMTEDKTGWQLIGTHVNIGESIFKFQERLDRINDDDLPVNDEPDPILQDRNPRRYLLQNSLNWGKFSSLELNKTWRRKEFHNGSVLEPIVGLRYMKYVDKYRRQEYNRYSSTIIPPGQPDPGSPNVNGPWEELDTETSLLQNNMFGGQLGARIFRQRGHWLLSAEARMFGMANFQYLRNIDTLIQTRYNPQLDDVQIELHTRTDFFDNRDQFVWGGEVRGEASYELTRDINLRFGLYFLDLGQGIGRGPDFTDNNQDVVMAGATFGFTINR